MAVSGLPLATEARPCRAAWFSSWGSRRWLSTAQESVPVDIVVPRGRPWSVGGRL